MVQIAPVFCLIGPTASGKTQAALALANRYPVEIVNVDAALVYRRLDIGSAKPSAYELNQVPHHLIDIRDPDEPYSVADFVDDAGDCIKAIRNRGNYPLLVGGTMMYYRALQYGLSNLPSADNQMREWLSEQAQQYGWPALHDRLKQIDPATAERVHPNDGQRIQRALEVYYVSGVSLSKQCQQSHAAHPGPFVNIGLLPSDRAWLHERIERRFHQLLEQGLIDEVRYLIFKQGYSPYLPALRSVGYRQVIQYLHEEIDYETMIYKAIVATRQLAKRQITWLRKWPDLQRIDCDSKTVQQQVLACMHP